MQSVVFKPNPTSWLKNLKQPWAYQNRTTAQSEARKINSDKISKIYSFRFDQRYRKFQNSIQIERFSSKYRANVQNLTNQSEFRRKPNAPSQAITSWNDLEPNERRNTYPVIYQSSARISQKSTVMLTSHTTMRYPVKVQDKLPWPKLQIPEIDTFQNRSIESKRF